MELRGLPPGALVELLPLPVDLHELLAKLAASSNLLLYLLGGLRGVGRRGGGRTCSMRCCWRGPSWC